MKNKNIVGNSHVMIPFILVLLIIVAMGVSCSETTGVQKGSITGYVALINDTNDPANDPLDFSGITVALYSLAKLDTTVVRINQRYPHIGVQISQRTEFDHRLQNAVAYNLTDVDGFFTIDKVSTGEYNLVAYREGWGFLYEYHVVVTNDEKALSSASNPFFLYPDRYVPSQVFDNYIFLPNRHYVFEENTNFHESSSIVIKSNSTLRINSGKNVVAYGAVEFETISNSYFYVTSNHGSFQRNSIVASYGSFKIASTSDESARVISNGVFKFGRNSLIIERSNFTVENCIFDGQTIGCYLTNNSSITVRNSLFRNSTDTSFGGLYVMNSDHNVIDRNLFINNINGAWLYFVSNTTVNNSYFVNNHKSGLINSFDSVDNEVSNSVFENTNEGILNYRRSELIVRDSFFNTRVGVHNKEYSGQRAFVSVNANNLLCSDYAVVTTVRYSGTELRLLDAKHNYWGTSVIDDIEAKIWDRKDEDPNDPHYSERLGVFVFQPFRTSPNNGAGISTY